jgi:NAD(P)-dependent dehydrogenase (short-subunit alcohol dehydrogenase family)
MTGPDRNGLFEKVGQALPVGRVGEPEDLAQTYLYLMRERFSTGAITVVDRGSALV